jgi:hypothetical protein
MPAACLSCKTGWPECCCVIIDPPKTLWATVLEAPDSRAAAFNAQRAAAALCRSAPQLGPRQNTTSTCTAPAGSPAHTLHLKACEQSPHCIANTKTRHAAPGNACSRCEQCSPAMLLPKLPCTALCLRATHVRTPLLPHMQHASCSTTPRSICNTSAPCNCTTAAPKPTSCATPAATHIHYSSRCSLSHSKRYPATQPNYSSRFWPQPHRKR